MTDSSRKMIKSAFLLCFSIAAWLSLFAVFANAAETIDLSGGWRFALDRGDKGVAENWFARDLPERISLPGILQARGFGDEISTKTNWILTLYDHYWFLRAEYRNYAEPGNVEIPFLSQPPRHYAGAAWYEKEFEIPAAWRGKRVILFLERPHWESIVWLDGRRIGSNNSLVAPHEYDFGILAAGKHRLSIRVDNRLVMPYRPDAHSVSDSLGGSWNGVVGKIELRATSPVWIDDAQIFTKQESAEKSATHSQGERTHDWIATIKIKIGNATNKIGKGVISANGAEFPVSWNESGGAAEIRLHFPNAREWDEFHPVLQKIMLHLSGESAGDSREITFGFRDFRAEGNHFILNNHAVYFRGTHHGGDFPLTGYPPTDVAYWRKILQICKDWGINHIRFHSFCPPEAAFQAADELGVYLQIEPGMWNEVSPGTPMERMLYDETERIIRAYGNHPSFLLLSPSNEPKGNWKASFDKWIAHYRNADPRRLYANGTGHTEREVPNLAEGADYLVVQRIGQRMLRGNTGWFGKDYGNSLKGINIPVIAHELGQWDAYPDYDVITKFTGYLRPGNYEIFRNSLAAHNLAARDKEFAFASGKFQLACYKEEIEANLRTPGLQGFQLLDLHDYLGQGTALVGLLDAFWEEKGYVTAKEFRRFNSETVPLARLTKRVFKSDEQFSVDAEMAHFGESPIERAAPYWRIVSADGETVAGGELPERTIPIGKNIALGRISIPLSSVVSVHYRASKPMEKAQQFKLIIGLKNTKVENEWNFWVYPAKLDASAPRDVFITHSWDEAETKLKEGAKVLYMPRRADLAWDSPPLDAVPVFWNRQMNPAWSRMLGLWIDEKHPALAEFPTDSFFDWQWTELVKNARAVNLDRLPKDLQPIGQLIDDWNRNYKLGLVFEAKVGRGKLMVASVDLENDLDERIVARQLRKSILDYMRSARFDPQVSVAPENFREILFDTRVMKKLGASVSGNGDAASAIDGDPNTFWLAGSQKDTSRRNQELVISFPNQVSFSGLMIMPRQNSRDHEGDVREYLIQTSDDGATWKDLKRGGLVSTFEPQKISFEQNVTAKFLKFISFSGFGADKTTALAELAVIYTGAKLPENSDDFEYKRVKSASPDIDEGVPATIKSRNKNRDARGEKARRI